MVHDDVPHSMMTCLNQNNSSRIIFTYHHAKLISAIIVYYINEIMTSYF